jgi:signal transduction histidine kinase
VSRLSIRLRLTLTYVGLLVVVLALVLGGSWLLLRRHLDRTLPQAYADAVLARLATQYALALAGAALMALGAGWAAAACALAPLRRIAATARRVTEERLDERVRMPAGPPDEIRELAAAFDAMLDRVAASVAAQRRFVANASHELRTPLTVIRTGAEVALDDPHAGVDELRAVAREAVETTERTEQLLQGLLLLAALDGAADGALPATPVDLAAITARAVAATRPEARAAGVTLRADLQPARTCGDGALLERLVGNLVENAIRHGGPGAVHVAVAAETDGARLTVANRGPVLGEAELARLTQPFERLHRAGGPGAGLGLSIVRGVAEAHGGALRLAAEPGGGLRATVLLPAGAAVTGS